MDASTFSPVLVNLLAGHRLAHESHLHIKGPSAGSDHKLLDRIYNELLGEYDMTRELVSVIAAVDPRKTNTEAIAAMTSKSGFIQSGDADTILRAVHQDQLDLMKLTGALSDKMDIPAALRAHFQNLSLSAMHRVYFLRARLGL